jgi:hypothetical protein
MLLGGRQSDLKQVAVVTRNRHFTKLFLSILADWKFIAVTDLSEAKVVFAEHGLTLPEACGEVIWLTSMPLAKGHYLEIPISLPRLYRLLESEFFPTPRRHIRVAVDLDVDLRIEGERLSGRLLSLSNRGGRIECPRELSRGGMLHLDVNCSGRSLKIPVEVLYCIPPGDSAGRLLPQVGILFKFAGERDSDLISHYVLKTCIETACARSGVAFNDPCVNWLELPDEPRG